MLCFKVLNGIDSVLRAKDANQILFAVMPLEYRMLVLGIDVVGDILEANYLQLSSCFCATTHETSLSFCDLLG